jgi:hypothetical protein
MFRDYEGKDILERQNYWLQISRKIFGPIISKEGWIIRNNKNSLKLINGEDIVKCIKTQKIKCWEHLEDWKIQK